MAVDRLRPPGGARRQQHRPGPWLPAPGLAAWRRPLRAAVLATCLVAATSGIRAGASEEAEPDRAAPEDAQTTRNRRNRTTLKVISLNIAHGRKDGRHQALQKRKSIRSNLDVVAEVFRREQADVVALQEADGPSLWSGRFNHVRYLAEGATFPHFVHGEHVKVKKAKLSYGTALLSQLPLEDSYSLTFDPAPPTFRKGFVAGTISWPSRPESRVQIASVHLDFARPGVRREQVEQIVAKLAGYEHPLILMGDFNCQWNGDTGPLGTLADRLDLVPYRPTAKRMNTFPKLRRRLDWILVSSELKFVSYRNLPDRLSDHRAVMAELELADGRQ